MVDKKYNPKKIEPKWQKVWDKNNLNKAEDFDKKPKKYYLVEFPYPSGAGLHVGHVRSYTGLDVMARKARMDGFNVMYPIGWDAFGLPTENYAIKNKIHPRQATEENIKTFTRQLKSLGLSFDWSREVDTTDSEYYKWTQWIFLKLYEKGLAYKTKMSINWCPDCKIGLANEEVVNGKCERCGKEVVKKDKEQWMLKITEYADRLIEDLETVDYSERIKTQQINWIGKSEGATVKFQVKELDFRLRGNDKKSDFIEVFTTRPDTLFGATYMVLAPEHPFVNEQITNNKSQITNKSEIRKYIAKTKQKTEIERTTEEKGKTGVELKGIKAINPANGEEIPVFIADYVLATYGTGAIMAVPAHDERDWEFAKKFKLEIIEVIAGGNVKKEAYIGKGKLVNSEELNGMDSEKAKKQITKKVGGKMTTQYKLRDWVFSRQHYWGEPIPMIKCAKCGWVPEVEENLPIELPKVKNYEPTDTGESPLADIRKWVEVKCPKCKGKAERETDTMPNWAGSSWYFLRYCDPKNKKELADVKKMSYWLGVDLYNGGMEHTTLHLLYSRFWNKFLYDIGVSPVSEPYQRRRSHGIVLGDDGRKMSKSFGNVVNPDEVIERYGADTLRLYEMFMGPFSDMIPWSGDGMKGVYRFLEKVWNYLNSDILGAFISKNDRQEWIEGKYGETPNNIKILLHQTIKKVGEDIEEMKFNTVVSQLMILVNSFSKDFNELSVEGKIISRADFEKLLIILAPLAPFMTEELWSQLGNKKSIFIEAWPKYDEKLIQAEEIDLAVQVNGKTRAVVKIKVGASEVEVKKIVLKNDKIKKWVADKEIKKTILVKDRLINFVV